MTWQIIAAGILSCVLGYLLGSLSFAVIISKCVYHKDVREFGSGNAGMTNILRTFGKKAAAFTLLGDMAKGTAAVLLARALFQLIAQTDSVYGAYLAGIFALLGHLFPLYFHFKGGKGVAVGAGTIIGTEPWVVLALIIIFLIVVCVTRIVSLSSIVVAALYPVLTYLYYWLLPTGPIAWLCALMAAVMGGIVIFMHRQNIKRLLNGTEYKFGQKKAEEKARREAGTKSE
ncbi:MAG: glycerol-3-phosphate 1-O-acyltransferase PlsY [Oscillospiraceae bacterium]|nr:glycerol-3-phosphate 1-O-acyltransferase PlsY [Oscillospiraceae bacterium]